MSTLNIVERLSMLAATRPERALDAVAYFALDDEYTGTIKHVICSGGGGGGGGGGKYRIKTKREVDSGGHNGHSNQTRSLLCISVETHFAVENPKERKVTRTNQTMHTGERVLPQSR
jgi:hypothetical protein